MAKEKSNNTEEKIVKKKVEKITPGMLISKANHIIEIKCNGQMLFIQPFGKVKVIKEKLEINTDDAKYLSFVKL